MNRLFFNKTIRLIGLSVLSSILWPVFSSSTACARDMTKSVLRITVTSQAYDFARPWQKKTPGMARGLGVVLDNGLVLTSALLVANATLVELEQIKTRKKNEASVVLVDYMANLALLRPEDPAFSASFRPLRISGDLPHGTRVSALQFESNGSPKYTKGKLKDPNVIPYPLSESRYLVYRVDLSFEPDSDGMIIPFFHRNRLAGLMVSYDTEEREATLIPAPVIRHFMVDFKDGKYEGFPRAGINFASVEDPQLRHFLGLGKKDSGIYINQIIPRGSAAVAGLQVGDVLLGVDGFQLNRFGEYDDPVYGLLDLAHLISTRHQAGEILDFHILRKGKKQTIPVTLQAMLPENYPIPPFIVDRAPDYIIVGGLIFQPLSGQLLRLWGKNAPPQLRYYQRHQWKLIAPGQHVIVLSRVLPASGNMGYENLGGLILKKINGQRITSIADIAAVLHATKNGFLHFKFKGPFPSEIYLNAATLDQLNNEVQTRYSLLKLRHLSKQPDRPN